MTLWHCCQDGGSTPPISTTDLRVGEVVTRLAHNQKIGGSIPPPATKSSKKLYVFVILIIFIYDEMVIKDYYMRYTKAHIKRGIQSR